MNPTLFNIYLIDLEEELKKKQTGGVLISKEKVWPISYADDIVLLAESEQELNGIMKKFERYLERKGLILSPEKSKVMVFERGRGNTRKRLWKWGEEKVEKVKEMSYLRYIMQNNGGAEKHINERIK